jgi:hypothetical protein
VLPSDLQLLTSLVLPARSISRIECVIINMPVERLRSFGRPEARNKKQSRRALLPCNIIGHVHTSSVYSCVRDTRCRRDFNSRIACSAGLFARSRRRRGLLAAPRAHCSCVMTPGDVYFPGFIKLADCLTTLRMHLSVSSKLIP